MKQLTNETIDLSLTEYGGNGSIRLYYEPTRKIGIAEAVAPYVSMDEFMEAFKLSTGMIKEFGLTSFVFDKRSLRAFHQPSMEWYFVQWKPQIKKLGLKKHFKILPNEDWFRKCVEAGRQDIIEAYGSEFLDGFTIIYTNSIKQAANLAEQSR